MSSAGFTGTRLGMKFRQGVTIQRLPGVMQPDTVHHGDCVGADEQFYDLCVEIGFVHPLLHVHPPTDGRARAHNGLGPIRGPAPYVRVSVSMPSQNVDTGEHKSDGTRLERECRNDPEAIRRTVVECCHRLVCHEVSEWLRGPDGRLLHDPHPELPDPEGRGVAT